MRLGAKLAAGAAAVACMLGAAQASQAAVIDWTLSNGTFDDGGTFSGTFSFDNITDTITQWNVSTTDGSGSFFGSGYSSPPGCVIIFCSSASDNGSGPSFDESIFIFGTTFALTNIPMGAPGSVAHLTGSETGFVPFSGPLSRNVTDGQAVGVLAAGVPEPAEWALMITGAGLAGAGLRRARRTSAAA